MRIHTHPATYLIFYQDSDEPPTDVTLHVNGAAYA